jgi:hypothetical protein
MFLTLQVTRDNVKSSGHFCGICRFHHWQCLIARPIQLPNGDILEASV